MNVYCTWKFTVPGNAIAALPNVPPQQADERVTGGIKHNSAAP
ncbi:hypothetical protein [Vacuolonema iberomarrocanum]